MTKRDTEALLQWVRKDWRGDSVFSLEALESLAAFCQQRAVNFNKRAWLLRLWQAEDPS